jgi:hypothetical protein
MTEFMICYGFYQFHGYLTRDKKMHVLYFLVIAENNKLTFIDIVLS